MAVTAHTTNWFVRTVVGDVDPIIANRKQDKSDPMLSRGIGGRVD